MYGYFTLGYPGRLLLRFVCDYLRARCVALRKLLRTRSPRPPAASGYGHWASQGGPVTEWQYRRIGRNGRVLAAHMPTSNIVYLLGETTSCSSPINTAEGNRDRPAASIMMPRFSKSSASGRSAL